MDEGLDTKLNGVTRRDFFETVAGVGLGTWSLYPLLEHLGAPKREKIWAWMTGKKDETIDHKIHGEPLSTPMLDSIGTGLFAHGIYHIAHPDPGVNLTTKHFLAALAVWGARYIMQNDVGKANMLHHINDGWDAGKVIYGTSVIGENVDLDLKHICEGLYGKADTIEDKVFVLTMFSYFSSSATTTVGSATMFKEEARDLAAQVKINYLKREVEKNEDLLKGEVDELLGEKMAYVSERIDQYVDLFSDQLEALKDQVEKEYIEKELSKQERIKELQQSRNEENAQRVRNGLKKRPPIRVKDIDEIMAKAQEIGKDVICDTLAHVADNSGMMWLGDPPFIAMLQKYKLAGFVYQNKIMWPLVGYSTARTLVKLSKTLLDEDDAYIIERDETKDYPVLDQFSRWATIYGKSAQKAGEVLTRGRNWKTFGSILYQTGKNMVKGVVGGPLKWMTGGKTKKEQKKDGLVVRPLEGFKEQIEKFGGFPEEVWNSRHNDYTKKLDQDKLDETFWLFKTVAEYAKSLDDITAANIPEAFKIAREQLKMHNIKERIEHTFGDSLADIVTVFGYQVLNMPWLESGFKYALKQLDKVIDDGHLKDAAVYFSTALFSMVADNYVATKIGIELYPEKPEVPLIGAIIGGSTMPPGNMANVALISLRKYGLMDGMKRLFRNADNLGVGYCYATLIPTLRKIPGLGKIWDDTGILDALKDAGDAHYKKAEHKVPVGAGH